MVVLTLFDARLTLTALLDRFRIHHRILLPQRSVDRTLAHSRSPSLYFFSTLHRRILSPTFTYLDIRLASIP
jgi:hypothetical protein